MLCYTDMASIGVAVCCSVGQAQYQRILMLKGKASSMLVPKGWLFAPFSHLGFHWNLLFHGLYGLHPEWAQD